jgi:hypothetical protein
MQCQAGDIKAHTRDRDVGEHYQKLLAELRSLPVSYLEVLSQCAVLKEQERVLWRKNALVIFSKMRG